MALPRRFALSDALQDLVAVDKAWQMFEGAEHDYDHGQCEFWELQNEAAALDAACDELRGRLKEASEVGRLAIRREQEKRSEKRAAPTRPREV